MKQIVIFLSTAALLGTSLSSATDFNICDLYGCETSIPTSCIDYDQSTRLITVTCSSANLTDVYRQLNDINILQKENDGNNNSQVWFLNSNLLIDKGTTFYINEIDVLTIS